MPSKKEMSNDCSISMTTVWRALYELSNAGCLEIRRQTCLKTCGNNGTSVNLYLVKAIAGPSDAANEDTNTNSLSLSGHSPSLLLSWDKYQPIFPHKLISSVLHDTLPDFTNDTPRTKFRKKVTINSRVKSLLSRLAALFTKPLIRFEWNRICPAKIE